MTELVLAHRVCVPEPFRTVGDDLAIVGAHYGFTWAEEHDMRGVVSEAPDLWQPWLRTKASEILARYPTPADCPRLQR
mgnify:CR=1 FL=1